MEEKGFVQLQDSPEEKSSQEEGCMKYVHRIRYYIADIVLLCMFPIMIIYIGGVASYLNYTPFKQVAYGLVATCCVFWLLSFLGAFLYRRSEDKKDPFHERKLHWFFFLSFNIATFVCMILMVIFMFPESFFPTGSFAYRRIGSVTYNSASFFIREPSSSVLSKLSSDGLYVLIRKKGEVNWTINSSKLTLNSASDFAGYSTVSGLENSTIYDWVWNIDYDEKKENNPIAQFKTFPSPGSPAKLRFSYGSCYTNGFPNFRTGSSFDPLIEKFKPDFFALIGDFIYADHPLYRGVEIQKYWELYRQSFHTLIGAIKNTPMFFMFDDHEFDDNYDKGDKSVMYNNAINGAWNTYAGGGNPKVPGVYYFDVDYGNIAMFFTDTRSYRSSNFVEDGPSKTIIGDQQKQYLKNWLLQKNSTYELKIIFSTVSFTTDFAGSDDAWPGFLQERNEILDFILQNNINGVLILTGDTHFPYMSEIGGVGKTGIFEVSASPVGSFVVFQPETIKNPTEKIWIIENIGKGDSGYESFFGIIDIDTTISQPHVNASIYDMRRSKYLNTISVDINKLTRSN